MHGLPPLTKVVLVCCLLLNVGSCATSLPASCHLREVHDGVRYESTYSVEEWRSNRWLLFYSVPQDDPAANISRLFPKENLDRLISDPAAAGARLMEEVEQHLCRPRPEGYTFKWSTTLQTDRGGAGPSWLILWSRQLIDGVPVENHGCGLHFDREGELRFVNCELLGLDITALPAGDRPDETDVVRAAEPAYFCY